MAHEPKDFRRLISECRGFLSEKQLQAHFTLYEGYVKKLNEIESSLQQADREKANYSFGEYSELRRREPVAYNGTVLHELYFENLGAEHAYFADYQTKKVDYLNGVIEHLNWGPIAARLGRTPVGTGGKR
jgi:Fe-Mn family superoxide dismutase